MLATILILLLVALLFVAAFALLRAALFPIPADPLEPAEVIEVESQVVAEHLARAIQFPTVSYSDAEKVNRQAFGGLLRALERMYPRSFASLHPEVVNEMSLLFTWPGSDEGRLPVLLCAHSDVAPVDPEEEARWTHPPFEGAVADGYVWGRGAQGSKASLVAMLEATEWLLRSDFRPTRTVFLACGHDGERSGADGAARIADLLRERGVRLEMAIDGGSGLATDALPGIEGEVGLIGVAEKGALALVLDVAAEGGHPMAPPSQTAPGILAAALARLEGHAFRPRMGFVEQTYAFLGEELPFETRLAFANPWLLGWAARRRLATAPIGNALTRNTLAVTALHSGAEEGAVPATARAALDLRLLPGESTQGVLDQVARSMGDERVRITTLGEQPAWGPAPEEAVEMEGYALLDITIRQIFPKAATAPFLVLQPTDGRHFGALSRQVYRFAPARLSAAELGRLRGVDERIRVKDCGEMVRFYVKLFQNLSDLHFGA